MNRALPLLLLILLAACSGKEDKVSYRLTSQERRQVDTLVSRQVKIMRSMMDSTCTANFGQLVAEATDSIVQQRLEQELRLRSRIPLKPGQQ